MSSFSVIISAKNVHVDFVVQRDGISSLKTFLFERNFRLFDRKNVLKGINLEIYKGESIGFLGRNGAGKSTLLRTLSGVLPPSSGDIKIYGRIAPMLSLGAGLEMEMSGLENIKLCCTLMGLSKEEIALYEKEIIDFSELGDSIHMQVKRYSSGMMARLAFASVVVPNPEILIVDEALAVGDMGFQQKCIARIDELRKNGTTILYVSHNPEEVRRICNRAIWIQDGIVHRAGEVNEVVDEYLKTFV
jgi:ABC-type polysaccharide/polyol phosphate transport system ATPase subunit